MFFIKGFRINVILDLKLQLQQLRNYLFTFCLLRFSFSSKRLKSLHSFFFPLFTPGNTNPWAISSGLCFPATPLYDFIMYDLQYSSMR